MRPLAVLCCTSLAACVEAPTSISFDPNDASAVGVARFQRLPDEPRADVSSDRDCNEFSSNLEAQRLFLQAGGPQRDPNDLDRDGDGFACEWGTELRQREAARQAAAQRQIAAASRCYTGPRGGTYTITASGNKNYDGC